ncbi:MULTISPECIES: transposase family protein [unclassified Streptomyces]|uniref:transposase family protein n=1 Tax=unclassified Streptomyces TaxID=2593676 RepID=UPI0036E2330F
MPPWPSCTGGPLHRLRCDPRGQTLARRAGLCHRRPPWSAHPHPGRPVRLRRCRRRRHSARRHGSPGPTPARAGRPGRKAFVSGKKKQNTIKTTTFSDHQGRTLFSGVVRPGRMHDQTAVRTEGIA